MVEIPNPNATEILRNPLELTTAVKLIQLDIAECILIGRETSDEEKELCWETIDGLGKMIYLICEAYHHYRETGELKTKDLSLNSDAGQSMEEWVEMVRKSFRKKYEDSPMYMKDDKESQNERFK